MDFGQILSGISSSGALQQAADRTGVSPDTAQNILSAVLGHADAGGGLETAAEAVAAKVGIAPSVVQQFLPEVLPLVIGHAANARQSAQPGLANVIGSLGSLFS